MWRKETLFRRRQMTMNDFKFNNVLETLNDLIISYSRARDTKRVDKRKEESTKSRLILPNYPASTRHKVI